MLQTNSSNTQVTDREQNFKNWLNMTCQKNREDWILCWAQSFVINRCEKLPAEEILTIKNDLQDYTIITDKTEMP